MGFLTFTYSLILHENDGIQCIKNEKIKRKNYLEKIISLHSVSLQLEYAKRILKSLQISFMLAIMTGGIKQILLNRF